MFVAKNSDATSWHELLHLFGLFCTEFRKATKRPRMHPNGTKTHQNIILGSNGVDRVRSLRKIPTRLRSMNYEMYHNISLGSNGVDRLRSLQKIPTRLRGMNFCTSSVPFASCFVRQPNSPKCTQIVENRPNHEFRIQWGELGVRYEKIPMGLHGTKFFTSFSVLQ